MQVCIMNMFNGAENKIKPFISKRIDAFGCIIKWLCHEFEKCLQPRFLFLCCCLLYRKIKTYSHLRQGSICFTSEHVKKILNVENVKKVTEKMPITKKTTDKRVLFWCSDMWWNYFLGSIVKYHTFTTFQPVP